MAATQCDRRQFRAARDFLLEHREDYATAYAGFRWPRPEHFNWALDWFDVIAAGQRPHRPAHRRGGRRRDRGLLRARWPPAPTGSPTGCAAQGVAPATGSSSCSATRPSCGRRRSPR